MFAAILRCGRQKLGLNGHADEQLPWQLSGGLCCKTIVDPTHARWFHWIATGTDGERLMMGRRQGGQEQFFYSFDLDKVVPPDHLVWQIDGLLDLGYLSLLLARVAPRLIRC
jgi:hypothetical protein